MCKRNLIFTEPPEDVDESWTHGAMLGGMRGYDNESLARSYFSVGSVLIEHAVNIEGESQELICPILFNYRHGIELYLKVILQPKKLNHSLGSLLEQFCQHVRIGYAESVPGWLTRPITQLAEFDPGSDLFRYETTRKPEVRKTFQNGGEYWVDLKTLSRTMSEIEYAFLRVLIADSQGIDALNSIEVSALGGAR